jgi:hypothetical protein
MRSLALRLRTVVQIGIVAGVVAAAGLVAVGPASPAQAGACFVSVSASTAGGGQVTVSYVAFQGAFSGVTVVAYDHAPVGQDLGYIASAAGSSAATGSGTISGLTPGATYWLKAIGHDVLPCLSSQTATAAAGLGGTNLWMQAYGRATPTAPCDAGWWGSYADWPNGGHGGWTCDRYVAIYG